MDLAALRDEGDNAAGLHVPPLREIGELPRVYSECLRYFLQEGMFFSLEVAGQRLLFQLIRFVDKLKIAGSSWRAQKSSALPGMAPTVCKLAGPAYGASVAERLGPGWAGF